MRKVYWKKKMLKKYILREKKSCLPKHQTKHQKW